METPSLQPTLASTTSPISHQRRGRATYFPNSQASPSSPSAYSTITDTPQSSAPRRSAFNEIEPSCSAVHDHRQSDFGASTHHPQDKFNQPGRLLVPPAWPTATYLTPPFLNASYSYTARCAFCTNDAMQYNRCMLLPVILPQNNVCVGTQVPTARNHHHPRSLRPTEAKHQANTTSTVDHDAATADPFHTPTSNSPRRTHVRF